MRRALVVVAAGAFMFTALPSAMALGSGDTFEVTSVLGDDTGAIPDQGVAVFPMLLRMPDNSPVLFIQSIQLEINGLRHPEPQDLDVYLIDPFGNTIEIMTDRGDSLPVTGVDLIFDDGASGVLGEPIVSGMYQPEGTFESADAGFATFVGNSGGTDAWILLVIDDAMNDTGSIGAWTLRGTVPEPATVSLLALGALAVLRRTRKKRA